MYSFYIRSNFQYILYNLKKDIMKSHINGYITLRKILCYYDEISYRWLYNLKKDIMLL